MEKLQYKGWTIIPTVLPTPDHQWTASCDLVRVTAHGEEVFEGATMQFVHAVKDQALAAACDEAFVQIDNIIANPTTRLA